MLKNTISFLIIILITLFLAEVSSALLFKSLAGVDFDEAKMQNEYQSRINEIDEKMNSNNASNSVFMIHPYLAYVHSPNAGINNYGMLTNHFSTPYKKSDNEFVIAVIGGSVASRFALDVANRYYLQQSLVQLEPSLKNKKIVVIPFAVGGYKQPQQLFALQHAILLGFEFDLVINLDGYNEIVMATRNYDKNINPTFPSGYHMAVLGKLAKGIDYNLANSLSNIYTRYQSERSFLELMKNTPLKQSRFMNLLAVLGVKYNQGILAKAHYDIVQEAQEETPLDFKGPSFDRNQNKYELSAEIWKNASIQTHAICQANNIKYLHVLQPNQYVAGSKPLTENEKKVAINESSWSVIVKEGYHLLSQEGAKLNQISIGGEPLLFADMTMVFKDNNEDLFFDDCCHFNARGNEILAQQIAQIIVSQKLYPTELVQHPLK